MSLDSPPVPSASPASVGSAPVLAPLGALEILAASAEPFVFVDGDFRVRFLNPAADRQFRGAGASLYGRPLWDRWRGALRTRGEDALRRAASEQVTVRFSERHDGDEGGSVVLEVTAYPASGGLAVFARDVTEQQATLEDARQAATGLWQELAELDHRNQALTRTNASLTFARHDAEKAGERMSTLLDAVGDVAAWCDAQWRWLFVNDVGRLLLARLGWPGDPTGRPFWDTLPQFLGTRLESETRRAAAERRVVEFEEFLPDTGQWLESRVVPLADGSVLMFLRDVTERHRQLEATRTSEEHHRALVEAATNMVWSTDANGQVTDMPFWRELTGQSLEQVRGAGWTNAIHPQDVDRVASAFGAAVASQSAYQAQYRLRLRDGSYRWYRARGVPVRNEDGSVREWVGLFNEVDRMIRRDEAMQFLAAASAALSATLDERTTLDTLARLAVDALADGAMITLVRDDGRFEHVATHSRDGTTAAFAAETELEYPLPVDAGSGYPRAIRTGEPELISAEMFHDDILPKIAADERHLDRLRRLDMYSGMVVPLIARDRTFGALTLVLHGPDRRTPFDEGDLALATELGRRAALAIDNARLFEAERRARGAAAQAAERLQAVADATRAFAESAMDPNTIGRALAGVLMQRVGDSCVVRLLDPADATLEIVAVRHRDPDAEAELERVAETARHSLDAALMARLAEPGSHVVLQGDEIAFHDDSIASSYGHLIDSHKIHSVLGVPLRSDARVVGVVYLARGAGTPPYDAGDVELVHDIADRAGLLLERARLFAAERAARAEAERGAELTRRLQEITASFARTITVNEVAATTLSHGLDVLGAVSGIVYLIDESAAALELVRREGIPDELLRPFQRIPLAAAAPATDAIRAGEILYFDDQSALDVRYPAIAALGERVTEPLWVMVPLHHAGRALGVISLGFPGEHEITASDRALLDALGRHCAQAMERARLLDAERDARDESERANLAKSDLLAKVSHETRQPVHASIGWVDTLEMELQGPITASQREALRRIKQNQLRLLTVLNDLLDMSRIEAGKLDLVMRDVVVADVVDAVESAVAPQMQAKGIHFDFGRPSPTLRVRADVDQLIGILTNMLSNAAKFTPDGGAVTVVSEASDTIVRIAVRDTGIGIPSHLTDRVFEPFFQVESGFTRTTVGTGLGLAISREAARAMGGDVTVESEVGGGSCFTVTLGRVAG